MSQHDLPSYIGRGLGFPLRVDANGSIPLESGFDDVDKAIRVILSAAPGERPLRPSFGCACWDLLLAPINANALGLMEDAVHASIFRWEPRVEVDGIDVAADPARPG